MRPSLLFVALAVAALPQWGLAAPSNDGLRHAEGFDSPNASAGLASSLGFSLGESAVKAVVAGALETRPIRLGAGGDGADAYGFLDVTVSGIPVDAPGDALTVEFRSCATGEAVLTEPLSNGCNSLDLGTPERQAALASVLDCVALRFVAAVAGPTLSGFTLAAVDADAATLIVDPETLRLEARSGTNPYANPITFAFHVVPNGLDLPNARLSTDLHVLNNVGGAMAEPYAEDAWMTSTFVTPALSAEGRPVTFSAASGVGALLPRVAGESSTISRKHGVVTWQFAGASPLAGGTQTERLTLVVPSGTRDGTGLRLPGTLSFGHASTCSGLTARTTVQAVSARVEIDSARFPESASREPRVNFALPVAYQVGQSLYGSYSALFANAPSGYSDLEDVTVTATVTSSSDDPACRPDLTTDFFSTVTAFGVAGRRTLVSELVGTSGARTIGRFSRLGHYGVGALRINPVITVPCGCPDPAATLTFTLACSFVETVEGVRQAPATCPTLTATVRPPEDDVCTEIASTGAEEGRIYANDRAQWWSAALAGLPTTGAGHYAPGEYLGTTDPSNAAQPLDPADVDHDAYRILTVGPHSVVVGTNTDANGYEAFKDCTGLALEPDEAGFNALDPTDATSGWSEIAVVAPAPAAGLPASGFFSLDPANIKDRAEVDWAAQVNASPRAVVPSGCRVMVRRTDLWPGASLPTLLAHQVCDAGLAALGQCQVPEAGALVSPYETVLGSSPPEVAMQVFGTPIALDACSETATPVRGQTVECSPVERGTAPAVGLPIGRHAWPGARCTVSRASLTPGELAEMTLTPANHIAASARPDAIWTFDLRDAHAALAQVSGAYDATVRVIGPPPGGFFQDDGTYAAAALTRIRATLPDPAECALATGPADPRCLVILEVPPDLQVPPSPSPHGDGLGTAFKVLFSGRVKADLLNAPGEAVPFAAETNVRAYAPELDGGGNHRTCVTRADCASDAVCALGRFDPARAAREDEARACYHLRETTLAPGVTVTSGANNLTPYRDADNWSGSWLGGPLARVCAFTAVSSPETPAVAVRASAPPSVAPGGTLAVGLSLRNRGNYPSAGWYLTHRLPRPGVDGTTLGPDAGLAYGAVHVAASPDAVRVEHSLGLDCHEAPAGTSGWVPMTLVADASRFASGARTVAALPAGARCVRIRRAETGPSLVAGATFEAAVLLEVAPGAAIGEMARARVLGGVSPAFGGTANVSVQTSNMAETVVSQDLALGLEAESRPLSHEAGLAVWRLTFRNASGAQLGAGAILSACLGALGTVEGVSRPAGVTCEGDCAPSSEGACPGGRIALTVAQLAAAGEPGDSGVVVIRQRLAAGFPGETASLQATITPSSPGAGASASVFAQVATSRPTIVAVDASGAPIGGVQVGGRLRLAAQVTNLKPAAEAMSLVVPVPAGATYVPGTLRRVSPSGEVPLADGLVADGRVALAGVTVPPGEALALRFDVEVGALVQALVTRAVGATCGDPLDLASCTIPLASDPVSLPIYRTLVARSDRVIVASRNEGTSVSVFGNDTLAGAQIAPGEAISTMVGVWPSGVSLTDAGVLSVSPGLTGGQVFEVSYLLCEALAPANCATATVRIELLGCDSDLDCPFGERCLAGATPEENRCVACVADEDCLAGERCAQDSLTCVSCIEDADCEDGNSCTQDACDDGVCRQTLSSAEVTCDDLDASTANDRCDGGGACVGTAISCPQDSACAAWSPNGTDCTVTFAPSDAACDDGSPSTGGDRCDGAGACAGTPIVCPEETACTTWAPNGFNCTMTHRPAATACDDGNVATSSDRCDGDGACVGSPIVCDEATDCRRWAPDGVGCTPVDAPASSACDDEDLTTGGDQCNGAGACVGAPIVCPEATPCTSWAPNGLDCTATRAPADSACDDGDLATAEDRCDDAGLCAGTPITCPADTACSRHAPDGVRCVVTHLTAEIACDDEDIATAGDRCNGEGACVGTPIECPDNTDCSAWEPDGVGCIVIRAPLGTTCDDRDATTGTDRCDGGGTCAGSPIECPPDRACARYAPNGTDCTVTLSTADVACDDGDAATANDRCDGAGDCNGSPITCPPDTACSRYAPDGVGCAVTHLSAETVCDDRDNATAADRCDGAGVCAGTAIPCPSDTACTSWEPDGVSCIASQAPVGSLCDDRNVATAADRCDGAGSCVGTVIECPADTACARSEPNGTDCTVTFAPAEAACDDGDLATASDRCDGAGGCSGTAIPCLPDSACVRWRPDGVDCEASPAPAETPCDDGDAATATDLCDGAGACAGAPIQCPADSTCTSWAPNGVDCTATRAPAETACDDGQVTTGGDRCDAEGVCTGAVIRCPADTLCARHAPNGVDCTMTPAPAETPCDDGRVETAEDRCDGAGACEGRDLECPADTLCTRWVRNGTACIPTHASPAKACDDGVACTTDDRCDGTGGCAGTSSCEDGAVCGGDGACTVTHCEPCEDDGACGAGSACLPVVPVEGAPAERRCLLGCEVAEDCADGQACARHADGSLRCFDAEGTCVASGEEPGPDEDPVEPDPVEPGPEPVEPDPVEPAPEEDAGGGADANPEQDPRRDSGGCSGGDPTRTGLGLLAAAALFAALRGASRRVR